MSLISVCNRMKSLPFLKILVNSKASSLSEEAIGICHLRLNLCTWYRCKTVQNELMNLSTSVHFSVRCWLVRFYWVNGSYQFIWEVYVAAFITVHIRHACKAAQEYHRHFSYLRIICLRLPLRIRAHQSIPFIRYAFCNSEAVDR